MISRAGDPVPGGVGFGGGVDVVMLAVGARRWLHGVGGNPLPMRSWCPFDALAVIFFAGCRCAWPGRCRLSAKRVISPARPVLRSPGGVALGVVVVVACGAGGLSVGGFHAWGGLRARCVLGSRSMFRWGLRPSAGAQ